MTSNCDSACSYIDTGSAVDLSLTSGDWFVIRRWENGPENTTTCTKVINKDLKLERTDYQNGKKRIVSGLVDARNISKCDGKLFLTYPEGIPNKIFVIFMDYDNFAVVRRLVLMRQVRYEIYKIKLGE